MKKPHLIVLFTVLVLAVCISIAPRTSKTYVFLNSSVEIVSIELMINTNETGQAEEDKLLSPKILSEDEIWNFMSAIRELKTRRCYPPLWGWGDYVAKVTYSNGDGEMLGSTNIEYVESGRGATGDGAYSFWKYGAFEEVFLRYLD